MSVHKGVYMFMDNMMLKIIGEGLLIIKDGREFQYVTVYIYIKKNGDYNILVIGISRIRLWGCLREGEE